MVEMRTTTSDEMEPAPAMASPERPSDSTEYEVPAERRALDAQGRDATVGEAVLAFLEEALGDPQRA